MGVVTQISVVSPQRDQAPGRRTLQLVPIVDGRPAITLVSTLARAPQRRC